MRRFTLAPKFILLFSALLIAVIIMAAVTYQGMLNIRSGGEEIYRNYLTSIVNLRNAEQQLADLALLQKAHIIAPNETVMKDIESEMDEAKAEFKRSMVAFAITLDDGEESELYQQYLAKVEKLFTLNDQIIELSWVNNDIEADDISEGSFSRLYRSVSELGKQMQDTNIQGGKDLSARNNRDFEKIVNTGIVSFAVVMLLFLALGTLVRRHIINALRQLTDTMKSLAAGNLNKDIPLMQRGDEIGDMARATRQFKETALMLEASEERAKASASAKSDFLANMSHEIRTPLNGVLGMVELMLDTPLTEDQIHYLKTVKRSGRVLTHVINDILDYSKIEAGALELHPVSFDFHAFTEQLASTFTVQKRSDIAFHLIRDPSVPQYLIGDENRLHQIIGNILSNAYKFTKKGSVTLKIYSVMSDNNQALIQFEIIDTGIGIPKDAQPKIFQPFKQADQSTHRRFGGTGLGLVICKQLTELMGGEVSFDSEAGRGSAFQIAIPMAIADGLNDNTDDATLASESEQIDYSKFHILLVEDNVTNQLVASSLLKKLGVQVRVADNGVEAVDLICNAEQHYDLVLMDCEMPMMDGYEATQRIRQWETNHQKEKLNICALTAHAVDEYLDRCYEVGMNNHIIKPYKFKELQQLINGIIKD